QEASCRAQLHLSENEVLILLFGGSLGAEVLNNACLKLMEQLPEEGVRLIFVTGKRYYEEISARVSTLGLNKPSVTLLDYADNMPELMKASDIVISRAGAIAVSEILACGKPSVLVPSPNVTNNHQYHNAKAIADRGAALLIEEKDMIGNYGLFADKVLKLASSPDDRQEMARNALRIAITDAAEKIYQGMDLS
ncbi:MAG: UDP-N-acetylglucosamine--N-acetylmuramyl-(pentapeptide) pyrophosphoryl-undecaprenol N-acetylglucosamine transferase, partial [Firmicutes bacterium]|nr:UDP-N-acetylglucosamine--N-acetylmuramyl-(pentapeptide) pyrophosphoryl-undecaprenol N-acetylglucosamine transferase [Bacillota bacterium]